MSLRAVWNEPRVPDPPPLAWWDWAFVGTCVAFAVVEAVVRPDLEMRPAAVVLGVVPVVMLVWHRSQPLLALVIAFGIHGVTTFIPLFGEHNHDDTTLYVIALILVLPYSLLRWASGREAVAGLVVMLVTHLGLFFEQPGGALVETLAGFAVLYFPAALGATMRYRAVSRAREIDQVKLREREQLARELH